MAGRTRAQQHWSHVRTAHRAAKPISGTIDESKRPGVLNLASAASIPVSRAAALLADEDDNPAKMLEDLKQEEATSLLPPDELHDAAQRGDANAIWRLLRAKSYRVDDEDMWGATALWYACTGPPPKVSAVSTLLQAKANPNACAPDGEPPLTMAARGRMVDVMRMLIHAKADPNHTGPAKFCALKAAISGPIGGGVGATSAAQAVRTLVEARSDVNGANRTAGLYGETPLAIAACTRQMDAARVLIGAKAKLVAPLPGSGGTPPALSDAQRRAYLELATLLDEAMKEHEAAEDAAGQDPKGGRGGSEGGGAGSPGAQKR